MNMNHLDDTAVMQAVGDLTDFILFSQRSCILNLSSKLNDDKVSFAQFFLLTYLDSEDSLTMSSIAQKMGHSTAAATGLVDKLEDMRYIKRVPAANDRRKIMVHITPEGKKLVTRMRQNIAQQLAKLMTTADTETKKNITKSHSTIKSLSR